MSHALPPLFEIVAATCGHGRVATAEVPALFDYPENGLFPHPLTEPSQVVRLLPRGFAA